MKRIGERIKRRRAFLNLHLNDLAGKVGITSSALSQIENSKAFPSIITIKSIAENLHTTVGELIGEYETLNKKPVLRKDEIKFVEKNDSGTELYLLSHHDVNKHMDTCFVRFIKGSEIKGLFTDNSGQIFCYLISGEINFDLEDKSYLLKAGDSIYFNSKVPYNAKNNNDNVSELIWIQSPPNF